jgi:hypothetical protein
MSAASNVCVVRSQRETTAGVTPCMARTRMPIFESSLSRQVLSAI